MRGLEEQQLTVKRRWGVVYLLLALVIFCGALLRLYKIQEIGLAGNDTVYYTNIAKAWSEGEVVYQAVERQNFVYRPAVFSIFGAAIQLFGFTDYSIKLANVAVDLVNIALLFAICFILAGKNPLPACVAALVYACSPVAIEMSRLEMTHVISTMMILWALLFFLVHERTGHIWRSRLALVLSAVFTGLAVLSHEDLVLTALGYVLFLGLAFLRSSRSRRDLETLVMSLTLFFGPLLFACVGAFLLHKDFVVSKLLPKIRSSAGLTKPSYFESLGKLLWNGLLSHVSSFFLVLFALLLFVVVWKLIFSKVEKVLFSSCLPAILLLSYAVGYVKLLSFFRPRVFFPFFPLVIIFVVVWCFHVLRSMPLRPVVRHGVLCSVAFLGIFFNLGNYQHRALYGGSSFADWLSFSGALPFDVVAGYREAKSEIYSKAWTRKIYDELAGKVNEDARLLVTSSLFQPYPGRRIFQVDFYFGDDAIYLIDHREPLEALVQKYNIKYVLFTSRFAKHSYMKRERYARYAYGGQWIFKAKSTLGASYGFRPGKYNMNREWRSLSKYLKGRGARLLFTGGEEGVTLGSPLQRKSVDFLYEL